jgi:O-antigen/teichoic acid export membrane protein
MFYLYADSTILAEYQIVVKSIFFALVAVFVHPVTAYTFPEISKYISNKELFEVKRLDTKLQLYLALFLLILLSSTVITKYLISLIFPSEYIESYKMLNILLPFLPFIIYTSFCINIIKAFNRFDLALYIRIIGSTVFFIAIYIFYILKFDAKSIVYSLSISFFVMFLLSLYYKKRLLK